MEEARGRIERARRAAEQAWLHAEAALAESEGARTDAEAGQATAERARAVAGAAQHAAEAARDAAQLSQAAAEAAAQEAELARRNLQNFLAMAGHDIRAPIAAILGYTELLADPTTPADVRERALAAIRAAALRMGRLVEDIVDAGRVGAGTFRLRLGPVDLVAVVQQVVDAQRGVSDRHRILVDAPDRLPGVWDADRLGQVLTNQVSNAIKYSPGGGEIGITVRRDGEEVVVSVSDHGVGFGPDDLPLLFQPFSRLYTEGGIAGAGLGLYISQGIVRAHGGRLWATSKGPGRGSTFTMALPLSRPL